MRKIPNAALTAIALAALAGCADRSQPPRAPVAATRPAPAAPAEAHAHKPGGHGGLIVEIGQDNYHAEVIFEKGGTVRLFTLGADEAKKQEVETQTIAAHVRAEGEREATPVTFRPEPQPGDTPGRTSQFVGSLPPEYRGKAVTVTAGLTVGGERYRFSFANDAPGAGHEESGDMPVRVPADEESRLYLTPGGKYTADDIRANGSQTASQKFKGLASAHNTKTRPGDRICPISETRASEKFIWVVGGKAYEFCCPPCVDEFVKLAKERPDEIRDPADYVKK